MAVSVVYSIVTEQPADVRNHCVTPVCIQDYSCHLPSTLTYPARSLHGCIIRLTPSTLSTGSERCVPRLTKLAKSYVNTPVKLYHNAYSVNTVLYFIILPDSVLMHYLLTTLISIAFILLCVECLFPELKY